MLPISLLLSALLTIHRTAGDVVVFTGNSTLTFESTEASFVPAISGSGMSGTLIKANPADACSTLDVNESSTSLLILLTMRGNCSFDLKVLNAQSAGFSAVIVYANDYSSTLLTMAGNPEGIYVHALYVTRESGEALLKYVEDKNSQIWLLPSDENSLWSIEVLLFVVVLAFGAALATWLITKNRKVRRLCSRLLKQQEPCVMRSHIVKAMPSITYRVAAADRRKAAGDACGICLEDYKANQNLRILPCEHRFHSRCVDTWLTTWQASCPICKCNIWCDLSDLEASERTPLLRSTAGCRGPNTASSEMQLHSNSINSSSSQHKSETSSHRRLLQCETSPIEDGVSNNAMSNSSPTQSLTVFCVCSDHNSSSPCKQ